jgi:hypothetical protein
MRTTNVIQAGAFITARPEGQKPEPGSKHQHEVDEHHVLLNAAIMPVP